MLDPLTPDGTSGAEQEMFEVVDSTYKEDRTKLANLFRENIQEIA